MAIIWTNEKLEILVTYLRNSVTRKEIARKMNMTIDAIDGAIRRYKLSVHIVPKKTTEKFVNNIDFKGLEDENFEELKQNVKLNWTISKSNKRKIKKKKFEMALFWPDTHVPLQNNVVCKSILKLMDDVVFDKIIVAGDFMDLGCISHWNKNRHKTLEMQRLKSDYIIGNSLLDEIDKRLPKNCDKYFLEGNHEIWANSLLEEIPALEGLIEPEELLYLKKRQYKFSNYNKLIKLGKLHITHGMFAGVNPIKTHVDKLKVNILFAHTHTLGMNLFSSSARDIAFAGYNIGCVCDLAPDYMKNTPNAWTHGFAIGYFYPNGYFDINLIRIVDGKFIFDGKIYDGNK